VDASRLVELVNTRHPLGEVLASREDRPLVDADLSRS
ncbi:MAG: hypothetical protein JWN21_2231, partial [Sphingomonas bacterium]|nr:hypothetical protein [Sphingomonas bacterium]